MATQPAGTRRMPVIMPGESAGHAGTGLVPEVHFLDLANIAPFIFDTRRARN
jgi:hypothetical protein